MKTHHFFLITLLYFSFSDAIAQDWYKMPTGTETRWSSFENPTAAKGNGGSENKNAKGHPSEMFAPGETKTLLNISGAGVIQRMWMTISDRSPQTLRGIKIEMFWDGATIPAVSVPIGDFFWIGTWQKSCVSECLVF
jgi:Protein of unknown function (DUF2961)